MTTKHSLHYYRPEVLDNETSKLKFYYITLSKNLFNISRLFKTTFLVYTQSVCEQNG
jgi:hypothetical protein